MQKTTFFCVNEEAIPNSIAAEFYNTFTIFD